MRLFFLCPIFLGYNTLKETKEMKRIVIIGAGISGVIAYNALRQHNPLIIEAGEERKKGTSHPAVFRLRDPAVAQFIGANYEKIVVQKAIFFQGKTYTKPNLFFTNLYSEKMYEEFGNRSIDSISDSTRYILPDGYPLPLSQIIWGATVTEIIPENNTIVYTSRYEAGENYIPYDYCISTIPMPTMASKIAEPPFDMPDFEYNSIKVTRFKLSCSSSIHQTIYFPDPKLNIYRITISSQDIIVEGIDNFAPADAVLLIGKAFGVSNRYINILTPEESEIQIGKIKSTYDDLRRKYIMWLTSNIKVFSFGRYSIWKPIRTDHLLGDIEKIKRWITATDVENKYNLLKGE